MATLFGQPYNGNNENNNTNNGGNTDNSQLLLKKDVKDWFVYRAADNSIVRPYPVFGPDGTPSAVTGTDPSELHTLLSNAFAIMRTVSFAGRDGRLSFVDYCSNLEQWQPHNATRLDTPYGCFINKMMTMLPDRTTKVTKSGLPTPPSVAQVQRGLSYSKWSIMFRGALMQNKGKKSAAKSAVNGTLFKVVYLINTKSAVNALCTELRKKRDVRTDWGPMNNLGADLFELDGVAIRFSKVSIEQTSDYACEFTYDPSYAGNAAQYFQLPAADTKSYHAAIRDSYGLNQSLADIVNIMTVEEMVQMLKDNYPISWVVFGLQDSPYASLLTPQEKAQALQDPELAQWFGVIPPLTNNAHPMTPQAAPVYQEPPAASYTEHMTQTMASAAPQPAASSVDSRMQHWRDRYSNNASSDDGIRM